MFHIPVVLGHRPGSVVRIDKMWSNRQYDKGPQNACSDDSGLRRARDGLPASRQHECRDVKGASRKQCSSSSHNSRHQSSHKGTSFFRKSSVGQKDSPQSKSGSSGGRSPKQSKQHSSHGSHLRKSKPVQSAGQPVKASRDPCPSSSSVVPSSETLDKLKRLGEKGLPEAAGLQAVEKPEMAGERDLPTLSEFEVGFTEPLLTDQPQEPSHKTDGTELIYDQLTNRLKAIASKTKEIKQAYYQDCETFGIVVKMLVEKDPSLENSIQFALRQNLHEMSECYVEELRQFIVDYDSAA
ncbi:periphilin-1-like isoform X2 [Acomys russatus]|uniref:periphilin-1-like isoform X2 n=1 Tax=Acomys russatus TaxID=60746 RepID=UPI0021E31C90|nr:periphilin-1-like isoform X2 [Acomys russatus]